MVEASAGGPQGIEIDLPIGMPVSDKLRLFRAGLRRWMRLGPDRLALKLKEWEYRSNIEGGLFEAILQALARYMPAGVPEDASAAPAARPVRPSARTPVLS